MFCCIVKDVGHDSDISSPALEEMVRAKVKGDDCNNASKVIRGTLRLMKISTLLLRQAKLKLLKIIYEQHEDLAIKTGSP